MTEHNVSFEFTARYYKLGQLSSKTRQVWFVLHGYGQLAQYFLKKFNALCEHEVVVIAPEGLSRFYLENTQGPGRKNDRVGATWMTKENRLTDIGNYIQYLNTLYKQELSGINVPVTVLGFSQGAATAVRWVLDRGIQFQRLVLWAGLLPADMDFNVGHEVLSEKEVVAAFGKSDPFLTDERYAEMRTLVGKLNVNVKEASFEGGHDIHTDTLIKIL